MGFFQVYKKSRYTVPFSPILLQHLTNLDVYTAAVIVVVVVVVESDLTSHKI
jgi:hypothetical protein